MNSRQRLLNAIRLQPVDHIPLYLRLWSMGGGEDHIPFDWHNQVTRAENLLQLGVDDTLLLQPPLGYTEEYIADHSAGVIGTEVNRLPPQKPGAPPRLKKVYHTPAGELTQVVALSDDWPHGENIMLFSDFNIPRYEEPLIKTKADIDRLRYLLASPTVEQVEEFRSRSQQLHHEAKRLGVALDGGWSALGDAAVWLCGMENVLYWQMDQPELLEALLDVLLEWELQRVDLLLQERIDVLVHMAWYEGVDFWTPKNYRRLLRPRLQQLIDRAHQYNVPFRYIITKGWMPLRKDLLEMRIDCLTGVDPVQDRLTLEEVKRDLGGRVCLMGGMNAAITLSMGSEEEIRQAVDHAMQVLAPGGGFILFPVDNVFCEMPWERVEILIDQWKKHWRATS
jgi:uroporphyrinogen-III decarboxylase